MELPVEGYPISDEAVTGWFLRRYGRLPGALEVGWIMDAMAQRETTPPIEGPLPETVIMSEPATGSGNIPPRTRQRSLPVRAALLAGVGVLALVIGGIAGDFWILNRWDEGQAVRPQSAMLDQPATPSRGEAATATPPAPGADNAVIPSDRPTNPAVARSDASQPASPSVAPASTGHPQAAPPPAAQTPAAQPVPTEQPPGGSQPGMPERSTAQSGASEQTAAVQTPAATQPVPTEQPPGASQYGVPQGSLAPSEKPVEKQVVRTKPPFAPPVGPDQIIRVQQALHSRGLYRGPIDGLIGPKTEAAVRAFQRTAGLAENGRIDGITLERLLGGAA